MTEDEKKEAFYAGWQAARARDQSADSPSLHSAYLDWSENYEPEGVDPLALMLDGADILGEGDRFDRTNVAILEESPTVAAMAYVSKEKPGTAEVAEAIFELEAWADYQGYRPGVGISELASLALLSVIELPFPERYLEAAARLRDGWRPKGWEAKEDE